MEACNLSFSLDETLSELDRQKRERERESDRRKRKIT
jgi:hypothetical protein